MLELTAVEQELAAVSDEWKDRYERHLKSAKAAMADLENRRDNVWTEGQMTYEDGMIACSAMQLAMWALWTEDD